MKSAACFLLLSGIAFAASAQPTAAAGELRQRGELTGARPSSSTTARTRAAAATAAHRATVAPPATDPVQQRLLGTSVNLAQASAGQLPGLYEAFIGATRAERRQWDYAQWDAAGQVLARLNQRYAQLRIELPLEERLRIRSFQGEFHTLRGTREVKEKLD